MDGHDETTFRRGDHNHDLLVGTGQDESQWGCKRQRPAEEDRGWQTGVRLPRAHGLDLESPGILIHDAEGRIVVKTDTQPDLHRLGLPLVGRIHLLHARPHLHHPQGVNPIHTHPRHRHDVLRLHLPIAKVVNRQRSLPVQTKEAIYEPRRPTLRQQRPRSNVAPPFPRRHKSEQ